MTLPTITYLTTDSISEGIGASQVLSYVERLAERGLALQLHSFEKQPPTSDLRQRLRQHGVDWHPHAFGSYGARGGVVRVIAGARAVRGAAIVHARSDLPAASTMLAGADRWLWDVRSLWADQRVALGALRADGPEHRLLQRIEGAAARRSDEVVTLTQAVIPVLEERHTVDLASRTTVISTCVDTYRFRLRPMPPSSTVIVMIAGTLNRYYDVPFMLELVERWRARRRVELEVVSPSDTPWDTQLARAGARRSSAAFEEMPDRIARSHVGFSICRADAGISLTASMPTKIAEFLASGRPVVVNAGLGDAGELVEAHRCGVAVRQHEPPDQVLDRLDELLSEDGTPERCRQLAEQHFDLERAANQLLEIYTRLAG